MGADTKNTATTEQPSCKKRRKKTQKDTEY
jgi:hypothetical protein